MQLLQLSEDSCNAVLREILPNVDFASVKEINLMELQPEKLRELIVLIQKEKERDFAQCKR